MRTIPLGALIAFSLMLSYGSGIAADASTLGCDRTVLSKSPGAVADPCMTTDQFINSLKLSNAETNSAKRLVAAAREDMSAAKLAH